MASIQKSVDDAKIEIKKNINKMVENGDDIETLEDQAKQLSIASEDYLNSAEESKNIAIWQNFKMWIIIFSVILFIFVIILYIIF
jgi:flagellar biosynthesis/type III secretory pathway M-ring protein FliF/YscJ